jgi:hypothetical protein
MSSEWTEEFTIGAGTLGFGKKGVKHWVSVTTKYYLD